METENPSWPKTGHDLTHQVAEAKTDLTHLVTEAKTNLDQTHLVAEANLSNQTDQDLRQARDHRQNPESDQSTPSVLPENILGNWRNK